MTTTDFENLVNQYIHITSERTWVANFGANSTIIALIWQKTLARNYKPKHLLWTLHYLKTYCNYEQGCQI